MENKVSVEREYEVHSPRSQSYRVTLPQQLVTEYSVSEKDDLGIELTIEDHKGCIDYIYPAPEHLDTRTLTEGKHTIRIPSSIGDAMQVGNQSITWAAFGEPSQTRFRAKTTYVAPSLNDEQWNVMKSITLKSRTVVSDNDSTVREHFDVYFTEEEREILGWDTDTTIGFLIVSYAGRPALRLQPMSEQAIVRLTPVNKSGFKMQDARIYIPRAMVRALNMADSEVQVLYRNNSVVIVPS